MISEAISKYVENMAKTILIVLCLIIVISGAGGYLLARFY